MYLKSNIRIYYYLVALGCLMMLSACHSEERALTEEISDNPEVMFIGTVEEEEKISTRAISVQEISTSYFSGNFYINIRGRNGLGEEKHRWSALQIPSGFSGSLVVVDDTYPNLNWFSRNADHYFQGWTLPWTTEYDPREMDVPQIIQVPFTGSRISETTQSTNGSSIYWKTGAAKNGEIMEKFVGAVNGPLDYLSNGQFVELQFRHLVSKIFISNFAVVDNLAGTSATNLRGEITFYGMPDEVPFYTCPVNDAGEPIRPFIPKPEDYGWDYDQSRSLTFAITNNSQYFYWQGGNLSARDCFYIPPEVDLSKLSFKVQIYEYYNNKEWIPSTTHGIHGAYYGDFSRVSFSRSSDGSNYDNYPYDGDDKTRLHAGEYLILNINLYENGEPSIRGTITNWRSWTDRDASQHVEDGIYSIEDMKEFNDLMSSSGENEEKLRRREEYHQNHGGLTTSDDPAGQYPDYTPEKKVIKIYDDIGSTAAHSSSTDSKMSSLYVADGFLLDGQGHTINVNSSNVSIGQVRDVYLRYYYYSTSTSPYVYTELIVYIDKMGNVYMVDPVTYIETPTGMNVNSMTKNPFNINLTTGKIS